MEDMHSNKLRRMHKRWMDSYTVQVIAITLTHTAISCISTLQVQKLPKLMEAIDKGHIVRGVQYMHCVMHKCIMVKLGGKRKTHKVCKKHKFSEKRKKNCEKWEKNNVRERGGKCSEIVKMGGKFKICG